METWETSVLLLTGVIALAGVPVLALVLMYKQTTRLLRISCANLGITPDIMESEKPEETKPPMKKERQVFMSVPIPGTAMFRRTDENARTK